MTSKAPSKPASSGKDEKKGSQKEEKNVQKPEKFQTTQFLREDWIEQQLNRRVKEFTDEKKLILFIGTWNVNGKKPAEDISSFICVEPYPDIYVIGFQEIVDLNAGNLLVDHNATKPWEELFEKITKGQYVQIVSRHLVGIATVIYVKRELKKFVVDLQTDITGVGLMGAGNKGGVVAHFSVYDTSLCIVNSHLAAHKNNVQGRNTGYQAICSRIKFVDTKASQSAIKSKYNTIMDHDHVFWIGDLNYRLNINDMALVYQRIDVGDWEFLLSHDQLIAEKAAGNAFKKFKEGKIDFAPTYKYIPGSPKYDRREDKKARMPAWCDRIQWIGEDVKQLWYKRAELHMSDHKPVHSLFEVVVKSLIPEKKKQIAQQLQRQLDAWENEAIPKVHMSSNQLVFSKTHFDHPVTQTVKIENTGQVMVQFHFQPRNLDDNSWKPWLQISPQFGIIPPKESIEISFTVHIDRKTAHVLNTGQDTFEDIVIFRVENGPAFFITIAGDYLKSCFGATVEYLCNMPYPVRSSQVPKDSSKVLSVSKEMWRMVDYIFRNGMDTPGLFVTTGVSQEIEKIRECLDNGIEFPKVGVHSMADALIRFIENLHEPIFPASLCAQYTDGMNLTAWCMQALTQLTPAHYNAFIYIASFLREALKHADKNELNPAHLVMVFARSLMHATSLESSSGKDKPKAAVVLNHFLTSDEFV